MAPAKSSKPKAAGKSLVKKAGDALPPTKNQGDGDRKAGSADAADETGVDASRVDAKAAADALTSSSPDATVPEEEASSTTSGTDGASGSKSRSDMGDAPVKAASEKSEVSGTPPEGEASASPMAVDDAKAEEGRDTSASTDRKEPLESNAAAKVKGTTAAATAKEAAPEGGESEKKPAIDEGGQGGKDSKGAGDEEEKGDSEEAGMDVDDEESGGERGHLHDGKEKEKEELWVECDKCKKWRRLPDHLDAEKLPSKWFCSMNTYDPERASCSAPEADYHASPPSMEKIVEKKEPPKLSEEAIRANNLGRFLANWVKRLKCAEKAEQRMPSSVTTRGKSKRQGELLWLQCCNPNCGKWRATLRPVDALRMRQPWYCVMNTWDESLASCAAPQETVYTDQELFD
ncbi:unnamed protein product [Chrysoparadoxa australica]